MQCVGHYDIQGFTGLEKKKNLLKIVKGRIHNNDEGRWQHPGLNGIALWDKVSQQLKHSPTLLLSIQEAGL